MLKKNFLLLTPLFYSVGNASEDIHFGIWRAKLENKELIIIKPYLWTQILNYNICNRELFKLTFGTRKKLNYFESIFLLLIELFINIRFVILRSTSLLAKFFFKYKFNDKWNFPQTGWDSICKSIDNYKLSEIRNDLFFHKQIDQEVYLQPSVSQECFNIISGCDQLKTKKKFVCVHVRESGFHNDSHRRPYRNASIDNYIPSIKFLIDKGFTVFRLGDKSMQEVWYKDPHLIDYPFTKLKSEKMDLYLIKHCEFFIGMTSGIYDTALLFNKPCLTVNNTNWFQGFPFKNSDRGILKKIVLPSGSIANNLLEIVELPYKLYDYTANLKEDEGYFKENSPEEILFAVTTFHDDYLSGFSNNMDSTLKYNQDLYRNFSDKILNDPFHLFYHNDEKANISRIVYRNLLCRGSVYDI